MEEVTEKERKDAKMATLYELRLIFTHGEKEQYTRDEIVELLDKIEPQKNRNNVSREGQSMKIFCPFIVVQYPGYNLTNLSHHLISGCKSADIRNSE